MDFVRDSDIISVRVGAGRVVAGLARARGKSGLLEQGAG